MNKLLPENRKVAQAICEALAYFRRSEIPYVLLTTHKARLHNNLDVPPRGLRVSRFGKAAIQLANCDALSARLQEGPRLPPFSLRIVA